VSRASKTNATGRIDVQTYEPQPYEEVDEGPNLVEIRVSETFSGDIEGDGVARFLQAVHKDGTASFVGIERVTGTIQGRTGSFLLQDAGALEENEVKGDWFVIPGSGTGELSGLRGEGGFTAALGQHASISLDYWFE
jgi:CO dehydrogenase/acetyl-CoA synthase gamma subunit (corrinoid Fe-S protein)